MKRLTIAFCGAAALGLASFAMPAAAMPLTAPVPLGLAQGAPMADSVAWRRVCRPVTRWRNGRRYVVRGCERVWVGPRRGGYYGPGPGRPGGPGGPPRVVPYGWR